MGKVNGDGDDEDDDDDDNDGDAHGSCFISLPDYLLLSSVLQAKCEHSTLHIYIPVIALKFTEFLEG